MIGGSELRQQNAVSRGKATTAFGDLPPRHRTAASLSHEEFAERAIPPD
jgi:hypothetical protein